MRIVHLWRLIGMLLVVLGMSVTPLFDAHVPSVVAQDKGKDDKDEEKRGKDDKKQNKDNDKSEDGGAGMAQAEGYLVEVQCDFDADADRTTCTVRGVAVPGAKDVSHVDVPESAVCSEVIGGDYEYVSPDPNTGITGFKSKGSRGVLTLVLAGEVVVDGTATYAIKSGDGVFRVEGPGFACDIEEAPEVEAERAVLRLVAFHCPTEGKSRTVFEALEPVSDDDADVVIDVGDVDVDVLEDEACTRAADVGFAVTEVDGEVVVRAATDGLGEAEVALLPATYTLHEDVLEASTEVTLVDEVPLTLAVVILGAVPLDVEPASDADAVVAGTEAELEADAPEAEAELDTEVPGAGAELETDATEAEAELGEVTDGTGAIVVRKHTCGFTEATPEIAWEEACAISTESATFQLTPVEVTTAVPASIGMAVEGALSFDQLPPGRYHLEEVGARWCHAQSDRVDAQGQVVVEAGQRSTVWIFNCGGPT